MTERSNRLKKCYLGSEVSWNINHDSKVYGANMRPTWVLSAPNGPHVGLMNLATWEGFSGVGSLNPGGCVCNSSHIIFKFVIYKSCMGFRYTFALHLHLLWMPQNLTNGKSALVQLMTWYHQATSHYLSQCCPSFLWPYGITRLQGVKPYIHSSCLKFLVWKLSHNTWQKTRCEMWPLLVCYQWSWMSTCK